MNKKRKLNNFWFIYSLVVGVVAICLIVALIFVYDAMKYYETFKSETFRDRYIESLDSEKVRELASEAIGNLNLKYEDPEKYVKEITDAFENGKIDYGIAASPDPEKIDAYRIDTDPASSSILIEFTKTDTLHYSMNSWYLSKSEMNIDNIKNRGKEYTVYVPTGYSLSVNGFSPDVTETNVPSPLLNSFEDAILPNCDKYDLGMLYSTPELKCTSADGECGFVTEKGVPVFVPSNVSLQDYTVSAPTGAKVYVNGVLLDESYIVNANVPYEYFITEKHMTNLPTYTEYNTGNLFYSPVVTCSMDINGNTTELTAKIDGAACTFEYPEELKYSLTVKVPEGSIVTIDGISIGDVAEKSSENAFEGLLTVTATAPTLDVYTISGLFTDNHTVSGTLDGTELTFAESVNGNAKTLSTDHTTEIDEAVSTFAMDFAKAYLLYTSRGYQNIDANLASALAYVESGSDLYTRIKQSKVGFDFQAPVTKENYKVLEVSKMYLLDDGTYVAKINFDVDQTIVYVDRSYRGEISLHITGNGTAMKVRDMVLVSEQYK